MFWPIFFVQLRVRGCKGAWVHGHARLCVNPVRPREITCEITNSFAALIWTSPLAVSKFNRIYSCTAIPAGGTGTDHPAVLTRLQCAVGREWIWMHVPVPATKDGSKCCFPAFNLINNKWLSPESPCRPIYIYEQQNLGILRHFFGTSYSAQGCLRYGFRNTPQTNIKQTFKLYIQE